MAVLVTVGISQGVGRSQQTATNAVATATNSATLRARSNLSLHEPAPMTLQLKQADTNSTEFLLSKTVKVHASGPVVRVLKAKGASDFSRKVLHLFSPFSDDSPNLPPGTEVSGPVSSRAWSTIAGWSPGRSAFPDESSHEPPQLRLISFSAEKLPKEP